MDDSTPWTCSLCGDTFPRMSGAKGQAASWCKACRKTYMREYMNRNSWKYSGATHGPDAPPIYGPTEPAGKWSECSVCGVRIWRRPSLCGSDDCVAENLRRNARMQRQLKPPSFVRSKRQTDRNRRMRKRAGVSERYDPIDIAERDHWRCSLCRKAISKTQRHPEPRALTMDHIIPVSCGGDDAPHNVRACHSICNSIKGNRTTERGEQLMIVG